jgi:hypothetical protein
MAIARTLSAVLIALSVALTPIAGSAVPAPAGMTMTDGADHDCCPKAVQPCGMTKDRCPSVAACGLLSSTLPGSVILGIAFRLTAAVLLLPTNDVPDTHASGPPLRPPQV